MKYGQTLIIDDEYESNNIASQEEFLVISRRAVASRGQGK